MTEFKSYYKTASGNEGRRCYYPTRLDTYGRGCQHNCAYCYAKSLLIFRKNWNNKTPAAANMKEIEKTIAETIPTGSTVRLGGMTDCFQPVEKEVQNTYNTIKLLNKYNINYLIVTKSDLVATNKYLKVLDDKKAHIQISITSTNDKLAEKYEQAAATSKRIKAIEKLQELGFDISVRLSPYIENFVEFDKLNNIKCDKILIEFFRGNGIIKKMFPINYKKLTFSEGGYWHYPLQQKLRMLKHITGFKEKSVCEDVERHYYFWQLHYNSNPDDCCNLRRNK